MKQKELCKKSQSDCPETEIEERALHIDKEEGNGDQKYEGHANISNCLHLSKAHKGRRNFK